LYQSERKDCHLFLLSILFPLLFFFFFTATVQRQFKFVQKQAICNPAIPEQTFALQETSDSFFLLLLCKKKHPF